MASKRHSKLDSIPLMVKSARETYKAHAALLLFAFLISTSFTIGRNITFALDPAALTFLRFSMAVMVFFAILIVSGEKLRMPDLRSWLRYFFLALLLVVFFVTMFEGLRWTTPMLRGFILTRLRMALT